MAVNYLAALLLVGAEVLAVYGSGGRTGDEEDEKNGGGRREKEPRGETYALSLNSIISNTGLCLLRVVGKETFIYHLVGLLFARRRTRGKQRIKSVCGRKFPSLFFLLSGIKQGIDWKYSCGPRVTPKPPLVQSHVRLSAVLLLHEIHTINHHHSRKASISTSPHSTPPIGGPSLAVSAGEHFVTRSFTPRADMHTSLAANKQCLGKYVVMVTHWPPALLINLPLLDSTPAQWKGMPGKLASFGNRSVLRSTGIHGPPLLHLLRGNIHLNLCPSPGATRDMPRYLD